MAITPPLALSITRGLGGSAPLARALDDYEPHPSWHRGVDGLELATGFPISRWLPAIVLAAATAIAYAVPRWRRVAPLWLFVTATHLVPRFAMGLAKTAFGRLRPREWLEAGGTDVGRGRERGVHGRARVGLRPRPRVPSMRPCRLSTAPPRTERFAHRLGPAVAAMSSFPARKTCRRASESVGRALLALSSHGHFAPLLRLPA